MISLPRGLLTPLLPSALLIWMVTASSTSIRVPGDASKLVLRPTTLTAEGRTMGQTTVEIRYTENGVTYLMLLRLYVSRIRQHC